MTAVKTGRVSGIKSPPYKGAETNHEPHEQHEKVQIPFFCRFSCFSLLKMSCKETKTDLVYYGYRYYSPALGRWMSRDPIEEQGGLNLYGFVNNDPVNKWDRLGLDFSTFCGLGPNYGVTARVATEKEKSPWPWSGCCGGKNYNRITHCCRKNVIYNRFNDIPTDVKICAVKGNTFPVQHLWLETPSGGIGVVADYDAPYHGLCGDVGIVDAAKDYVNDPNKKCAPVYIFPCTHDKEKFLIKLEEEKQRYLDGKIRWGYSCDSNCIMFIRYLIQTALNQSKW